MTALAALAEVVPTVRRTLPPEGVSTPRSSPSGYEPAAIPANEAERLEALRRLGVLDTLPEREFDDIVRLASEICGAPMAMVSLLDEDRQWFKAVVGLDVRETPRSAAFCAHAILGNDLFVVRDAKADPRFARNPLVVDAPGVRFYAGAPLATANGLKLGALCVIDRVPRQLAEQQREALSTLGRQVEAQLRLRLFAKEMAEREAEIRAQRDALIKVQRQRDELTSLIVHDLKSPLASILPNARFLLAEEGLSGEALSAASDIQTSAQAMHRMVLDLLDVSRSEDGTLTPSWTEVDLTKVLEEVQSTVGRRATEQRRRLRVSAASAGMTLRADTELLRRVLENLLDNALKYTDEGTSVTLDAEVTADGGTELRVSDEGNGVPPEHRIKIFEKYVQLDTRVHARSSRGLGLAFCRLAVEAMGGRIWVEDNLPRGSCFCVRLPRAQHGA